MFKKYLIVGILCTAIFYAVANVFAMFLNASIATFAGNLSSFVFGYFAQMRFTFEATANHKKMLVRYSILLALIFAYSQAVVFAFENLNHTTQILKIDTAYWLVSFLVALSIPLFSYPLQKFWVFSESKTPQTSQNCALDSCDIDSDNSRVVAGGGGNLS